MELRLFSWDDAKNQANRKKHGVSFKAASLVSDDRFHINRLERVEAGAGRWQTIGMAGEVLLLLVAHT
ncbi:MAG: BrnT family toxin [Candidatus Acidiferrum sp.]